MKISVLCTDTKHPVMQHLRAWQASMHAKGHDVELASDKSGVSGGDILFLVSCAQLIHASERARYQAVLVLHASDLPEGRGWSPHVWFILNGSREITVCLLEAVDSVDTGAVWLRCQIALEGHELLDEINAKLFEAEIALMTEAIDRFFHIEPQQQDGEPGPHLRRRTPEDSRLDPEKTIAEQFDLLRIIDAKRFPAFFDFRGHRYVIQIAKQDTNHDH